MTSALAPTAQPTTLRIPRTRDSDGDVLDWYYLEIRARGGVFDDFSLSDSVLGGVSIRVNDDPAFSTRSKLLDAHPNSGGIANAPLAPGETFSDGQVNITTVSANGGEATVEVVMGPPLPDTRAPSAPSAIGHTVMAGRTVRLAWTESSDNRGVQGYAVFRDGAQIATSASTQVDDPGAPAGQHVYTVFAEDAAGNRSASSAPHVVSIAEAATRRPSGATAGRR